MKSALRLLISFGISAALLVFLLRGIDTDKLVAAFRQADWRLIPPAIVLYFIGAWLRSVRWGLLLPEYRVPTWTLFKALVVGFTVNNLLPVRMGEVARAYLLARWSRVPYGATISSLVVERILDGLSLAALLLLGLRFVPDPPGYLVRGSLVVAGIFCLGALVVALAAWRADLIVGLTTRATQPLPARLRELSVRLATSFARNLALVRGKHRLMRVVALSLLAWCFELSLFVVLMPSLGIVASVPVAFLVGSASNFATLVPSAPGYVGTFEAALTTVLRDTAGIQHELALAYAFVVHATLFLPVVILGTLVLWRSRMTFTQITHEPDRTPASTAESDLVAAA
jgi:uncharacterized protein (TIRG00374 family)